MTIPSLKGFGSSEKAESSNGIFADLWNGRIQTFSLSPSMAEQAMQRLNGLGSRADGRVFGIWALSGFGHREGADVRLRVLGGSRRALRLGLS